MSELDELEQEMLSDKEGIEALREAYRVKGEHRRELVRGQHLEEAVNQLTAAAERDGRDLRAQAYYWLLDEGADDPGHRIQAGLYLRSIGEGR